MAEQLSIEGKIIAVLAKKTGTSQRGEWSSQEFVLQTADQYPQKVCFEIFGEDKINQADLHSGDEVNIGFNLDCSEYKGRWYNKIKAWRVSKKGVAPKQNTENAPQPSYNKSDDDNLGLPF